MRHTYATNMLYKNLVSPTQLARLLGHTNPKMIYDVQVKILRWNENFREFRQEKEKRRKKKGKEIANSTKNSKLQ